MAEELSDLALTLLRILHEGAQDGPKVLTGFKAAYDELEERGLIANGQPTEPGIAILHRRNGNN